MAMLELLVFHLIFPFPPITLRVSLSELYTVSFFFESFGFFTVTLHLSVIPFDLTMMLHVPSFFAVISPDLFTVAIFLLLDLNFASPTFPFTLSVFDSATYSDAFLKFRYGFFTVIFTFFFVSPFFTVMVALPFAFAVILPFEETVATFVLEDE